MSSEQPPEDVSLTAEADDSTINELSTDNSSALQTTDNLETETQMQDTSASSEASASTQANSSESNKPEISVKTNEVDTSMVSNDNTLNVTSHSNTSSVASPDKNNAVAMSPNKPDECMLVDQKPKKVDILLKAAGDAPIMKKKKWAVDGDKPVSYLTEFVRRFIKCEPSESLFIYVNQTFVPSPDQILSNLFECFGTDGKLVLHYCKTQAWG